MKIEGELKDLILERYGSVKQFASICSLPYGTVDTILRRGVHNASIMNIITICKTLDISTDELARDRIVPNSFLPNSRARSYDLDHILRYISTNKNELELTLDEATLSECEFNFLLDSIELITSQIRKKRKDNP